MIPSEEEGGIGVTTGTNYWERKFYNMHAKDPPDTIRYRTEKTHTRKRFILLGLMEDSYKYVSVHNIDLSR